MSSQYNKPIRSWEHLFKVIIIGDSFAGKTALTSRFADDEFSEICINTIGIDVKSKTIEQEGKKIKLQMFDTAGQCRFRTLSRVYYKNAHGAILVYDSSERESFDHIESWLTELKMNATKSFVPIIVGNKIDLDKKVQTDELKALAKKFNCKYFETSAKENIGIDQLFKELISDMLYSSSADVNQKSTYISLMQEPTENSTIDLSARTTKTRKCCS